MGKFFDGQFDAGKFFGPSGSMSCPQTSFFGGSFFCGDFFNDGGPVPPPPDEAVKTGTGGIDPGDARKRRTFKPTGLLHLPVKARPTVKERVDQSAGIASDIADKLAREFTEETQSLQTPTESVRMSLSEVDAEIGRILRKKVRTEEDEVLLLLLMAAVAA